MCFILRRIRVLPIEVSSDQLHVAVPHAFDPSLIAHLSTTHISISFIKHLTRPHRRKCAKANHVAAKHSKRPGCNHCRHMLWSITSGPRGDHLGNQHAESGSRQQLPHFATQRGQASVQPPLPPPARKVQWVSPTYQRQQPYGSADGGDGVEHHPPPIHARKIRASCVT